MKIALLPTSTKSRATLAFITVSLAWGTTYAGNKIAVETIPPFALAAIRFIIAGVVMMAVLRAMGIALPKAGEWPGLALIGVLLLAVSNSFMAYASQYLPSVLVSLLLNISPLLYVAMQSALGEHVPKKAWRGLAIGFMGVLILIVPKVIVGGRFNVDHHTLISIGALVLGPLAWNLGAIYATHRPIKCNHLMSAAAQNLAGGIGAMFVALPLGEMNALGQVSTRSWLAMVWLIIVGSWLGYVAYLYCVLNLSSPRVAITTYINNVVALFVGWLTLGEMLTKPMLLGGAVLLVGVWIVRATTLAARQTKPKTEAVAAVVANAEE
ncbi:EamA family transporter [bacterium]|nr:EamA family transporter [bacterium]